MKMKTLIDAAPALKKIANSDMSIKTAYAVKKLVDIIEPELEYFDETRCKIIDKYSEGPEGSKVISDAYRDICAGEIADLLDIDVKADITPVKIPAGEQSIKIAPNDLMVLAGIIDFEVEENE